MPRKEFAIDPKGVPVDIDDRVLVQVRNSVANLTLNAQVRIQDTNGRIQLISQSIEPNAARTANNFTLNLATGFLLGIAVNSPTTLLRRGQTYVTISLVTGSGNNAIPWMILASDYIENEQAVSWPRGRIKGLTEPPGFFRLVEPANPNAGSEILVTQEANTFWKIHWINYTLVTDTTAGDRHSKIQLGFGTEIILDCHQAQTQAGNLTREYHYYHTVDAVADPVNAIFGQLPIQAPVLSGGTLIQTTTNNLSANDQYQQINILVEEWLAE